MDDNSDNKAEILTKLRDEFAHWEALLPTLSAAQIMTPRAGAMTLKDELAHLWAWQQISRAHVRAASAEQLPVYPTWPVEIVPVDEGDLTMINDWIMLTYRDQPWPRVYADWRAGFADFLAVSEALPHEALFTAGKYIWLGDHRLVDVLLGSYDHHLEHRTDLMAWLRGSEVA